MSYNIDKPVFIIGCPRSGTTIFMDILSHHSEFSWPSKHIDNYPHYPQLAFLSRIFDIPILGGYLKRNDVRVRFIPGRWIPRPSEAWSFYMSIDPQFRVCLRSSPDVQAELKPPSDEVTKKFRRAVSLIQIYQGKNRFVAKYTDKPRINYINHIFPDSLFIHIVRDGKAVVNSLYNKVKRKGWFKPDERKQWINTFPEDWRNLLPKFSDPLITFLSYWYRHIVTRITDQLSSLQPKRTIIVRYEDIITKPLDVFKRITEFIKVPWTKNFEIYIRSKKLENMNYKYKTNLSNEQIKIMDEIFDDFFIANKARNSKTMYI